MKRPRGDKRYAVRWLKFYLVGGIGIAVQLLALAALKAGLGMNYMPATALAVEAAIVHNYLWHDRFTWKDRLSGRGWVRFLKFNATTGAVSILGNLAVMAWLVGMLRIEYLPANCLTVAACSVLNFLVSDRLVFQI